MTSLEKANMVLNYLRSIEAETWVKMKAGDKTHLHKSYELIKNNPKITEKELIEKLGL